MSADRDDNHSDSLDVAEQHSSSPTPSGDGGPRESAGNSYERTAKTVSSRSQSSRGRGEGGRGGGKASSRSKTRKGHNDTSQVDITGE